MRDDLPAPNQCVQCCHAVIEATKAFSLDNLSDHPYVIVLSGGDERELHRKRSYLINNGVKHVHFYESDLDEELTAVATEPISGERRKLFKKFKLLKNVN